MTVTAASAYAPSSRNSYFRRLPSSHHDSEPRSAKKSGALGLACFLIACRVWKSRLVVSAIDRLRLSLRPYQSLLSGWVQKHLNHEQNVLDGDDCHSCRNLERNGEYASASDGRVHENQQLINNVLLFWFGQYPPSKSQKMLWMIASSSLELQHKVDHEIQEKYEGILLDLVEGTKSRRWNEWVHGTVYGHQGKVAAIVVLDQFYRHIKRNQENNEMQADSLPPKAVVDALALTTAQLFVERHQVEIDCGMIPLPMYIFSLMPFRHSKTIKSIQYVQECVDGGGQMVDQDFEMLGRFRKATNRRLAALQDETRRAGKRNAGMVTTGEEEHGLNHFTDENILETGYFEADMTASVKHAVHKTVATFLSSRGIHPGLPGKSVPERSFVIVSLSGGVDSMVIASVLSYLARSCNYNMQVYAVHIDYANRPESRAEAEYVRRYCEQMDVLFECRRIDEVTRGVTARDDYERIARSIRYSSYKEVISLAKKDTAIDSKEEIGVILGHHRADLRENVLSNANTGKSPINLSGMTAVSTNDGVIIYRPLLSLEKAAVFDYAHKFGVPYFKDTTPHWSTRGKIRNKLLPLLQDIYGEGSMKNLSTLAMESDACRELLSKSMVDPFLNRIIRKPMGIIFETAPWRDQPEFFWKSVLREALHSAKFGMFSDKSMRSFLERVLVQRPKAAWLQCRKDYAVYLQEDGRVFVFYPSSFPWNGSEKFQLASQAIAYDEEKHVGPWRITAEIVNHSKNPDWDLGGGKFTERAALTTMEVFMDGDIEYFIEVPTWRGQNGELFARPLTFCEFTKTNRPVAWKASDLKIQATLPLLANDNVSENALQQEPFEHDVSADGSRPTGVNWTARVHLRLRA